MSVLIALVAISPALAALFLIAVFQLHRSDFWRRVGYIGASIGSIGIASGIIVAAISTQLYESGITSCSGKFCELDAMVLHGPLAGLLIAILAGAIIARRNPPLKIWGRSLVIIANLIAIAIFGFLAMVLVIGGLDV